MFCHKNSKLKYDSSLRALYKSYVHQWLNKILVHRRILFSHFFSDIVYILMESSLNRFVKISGELKTFSACFRQTVCYLHFNKLQHCFN